MKVTACVIALLCSVTLSNLCYAKDPPKISAEDAVSAALAPDAKREGDGYAFYGRGYSANFSDSGITFLDKAGGLKWSWSFKGIYHKDSGRELIGGSGISPSVKKISAADKPQSCEAISYSRSEVEEIYLSSPESIEQRFILNRPLSVDDGQDIVIRGIVRSDGEFKRNGGAFVWNNKNGGVSLSKLYVYDALGKEIRSSLSADAGGTEIILNGADLLAASYPVTVDPEIGTNDFRISIMGPDGDTNFEADNPVAAYNPKANEYLIVWEGDDNTAPLVDDEYEIFGQRIDAKTGAKLGDRIRISDMGPDGDINYNAYVPSIAYNSTSDEYLVVWEGDDNTAPLVDNEFEIFGQRIDGSTGAEVGTNDFRISDMGPDGNINYAAYYPSIAYNSTSDEYLVVWEGDDNTAPLVDNEFEIFGQILNGSTGAEVGNDFRISDMGPNGNVNHSARVPAIEYNPTDNEYLVVWEGDDSVDNEFEIYGQRIDGATGAEVGTNDFRISDMGPDGNTIYGALSAAVAHNSTNDEYLVVWEGDDDTAPLIDNEFEIFGQRLDGPTGAEIGGDFRISDMGPNGDISYGATNPSVAYNPTDGEYLVAWYGDDNAGLLVSGENEIFGQRLNGATGAEIGTNDFRISDMGPDGDSAYDAFDAGVTYNSRSNSYLISFRGEDDAGALVPGEYEVYGQLYGDSADLSLVKTELSDPVGAGSTLNYLLVAANVGSDKARSVTLTDTLPAGTSFDSVSTSGWACSESSDTLTCTLDELDPGIAPLLYVNVDVDSSTSGTITNTAMIESDVFDPDSSNDMVTEDTTIVVCQLEIVNKRCQKKKVNNGSRCKLRTTVTQGGSPLSGANYTLQKKRKKKAYKDYKSGTTKSAGKDIIKFKAKKTFTYKSVVSVNGTTCETSELKIKVKRKK